MQRVWAGRAGALAAALVIACGAGDASASQDLAGIVARAREQVENGSYADALRTLAALPKNDVPPALAIEASLLETTAALVTKGADAGAAACARAVVASGYDPEVARDQSPKVRTACRASAEKERRGRLAAAGVKISDLEVEQPEVAWQPVRISATASSAPPWLRVVARIKSSALEGSFDLPLAPSPDGPLRGTLDPSWIRAKAKIEIAIVAQDKFGDLAVTEEKASIQVPAAEALVALGDVPSSARVLVDGDRVTPDEEGRVAVSPGKHTVEMELDTGASSSAKVDLQPGGVARVALSPQRGSGRTLAWVATGSAVVLGAVGGVLLINAAQRKGEIEELAGRREPGTQLPATDYAEIKARDDERRLFTNLGMGLAIGGGAVGVAALTLWLLPEGGGSKKPAKKDARASGTWMPLIGPGSVGVTGTF
ncbi:hypothetical protein [Polyangium aurulentum]|uniref:hypothetical protein n=1 Tax=Polyangium aurulentum TaxID=2567896 RepID=UPI0010AEA57A|nr:hypothetical protein [Polyangium aurulentum]UQA59622.1 hypothetical protein E8A73_003695 [Polyangium aurulentum]